MPTNVKQTLASAKYPGILMLPGEGSYAVVNRLQRLCFLLLMIGVQLIISQPMTVWAAFSAKDKSTQALSLYGGGQIAFTSIHNSGLDKHVFVINPDGTGLRQVSTDPDCSIAFFCSDSKPVWSPDGKHIAFFSGQDQQSGITLDVVNLSTGKQLTLATNVASVSTFSWTSDSQNIAFVTFNGSFLTQVTKIYLVSVDGGQPQKLIDVSGSFADAPLFSPDGQHLLFRLDNGQHSWVVSDPQGSNQHVINTDRTYAKWSPDSKSILIGNTETNQISIVDASNGSQLLSVSIPSETFPVAWSPDGQSILLEWFPLDSINTKFYVFDVKSKAIREITSQPAEYRNASWSPNSKYVIVEADSRGVGALNGLYIINVEDKSMQKFLDGGNFEPTWSATANLANETLPTPIANTPTPVNGNTGQSAHLWPR